MAKVRAYKLAEELGMDRNELVEKALEEGIELKSPMSALEPEQLEVLRGKFGLPVPKTSMDEERVERKGGSTILRRRRKKVELEPVVEVAPVAEVPTAEVPVQEPGADEIPAETPVELEPGVEEPVTLPVAVAPAAAGTAPAARKRPPAEEPPDRKGKQRKRVREVVNLREQEQVKLQYAGRGGPRRRTPIVAPRSVVNPRRL